MTIKFSDIKISHKLIGSYAAIILLVAVMALFSIVAMFSVTSLFNDYRTTARSSLLLGDLTQYLTEARGNMFQYRILPSEDTLTAVKNDFIKLKEKKEFIGEIIITEESKQKLLDAQKKSEDLEALFQTVVDADNSIRDSIRKIESIGTETRLTLSNMLADAYTGTQNDVVYSAALTQQSLMLARYYGHLYLLYNQDKHADRTLKELNDAMTTAKQLLRQVATQQERAASQKIVDNLELYLNSFQYINTVTVEQNEKYAAIDTLGENIFKTYAEMLALNQDTQNSLGQEVTDTLQNSKIMTIVKSLVIVILSVIVALFMARMIVSALSNVTSVMSRLREGDFTVKITGTDRGDEVGDMSRAIEQFKQDAEQSFLLKQMVDDMPTNVMTVDVRDGYKVNYLNNAAMATLSKLEEHLSVKANEILGTSNTIFDSDPEHQNKMLSNPDNMPHRSKVQIGPEKMALLVSAIRDKQDQYVGAMLTWEIITAKEAMGEDVGNVVSVVTSAVTELEATAQSMSSMAQQTQSQSTAVAAAAEEASTNVSTVASSAEELNASIAEISQQMQEASRLAQSSQEQAMATNATVGTLKEAADKIGEVVNLINDIAEQTNLLALNATIEAARAGDAGKGFAVVANEVKALANETAKATEDINRQIQNIQGVTKDAVLSISSISESVTKLSDVATSVASAVEEQNSATQEIARSVEQAALGTREVTEKITDVSAAAQETGNSSTQVLETAKELATQANSLQEKMKKFLQDD